MKQFWTICSEKLLNQLGDYRKLHTGSIIRTSKGMGTIVGGSITVKLDRPLSGRHPNDRTWAFNLDGEL